MDARCPHTREDPALLALLFDMYDAQICPLLLPDIHELEAQESSLLLSPTGGARVST